MQMSNRTAKFVSALFASLVAGAPLMTVSHGAAPAADECLSGPKGQTPQGGHWYYRVDRTTKRHCWYLGDEREKLSQIAPPNSARSAKPASPKAENAMQPSIADAHAELPVQTRIEAPNAVPAAAMPANTAARENNGSVWTPAAETQRSVIASRWPDQSSAAASPDPAPANRDAIASADPTMQTPPPPVVAAEQFAAADSSSETSAYSVPVQLTALMGALALAGIIGGAIFRFVSTRRPAQGKVRERRGVNWESANTESTTALPIADASSRRPHFVRDLDQAGNERIAEFFSQLSKRPL
jgi:hypothetical protein